MSDSVASKDIVGSSLEVDEASKTNATVASSEPLFKYENGRRYHLHSDGHYYMPNDDPEKDRLDLQHRIWKFTLNGALYTSPLPSDISHVLDVGTGTGNWAIEFAHQHPKARVLGTDLSAIQPSSVPLNCTFTIANADEAWSFEQPFDFIHSRMIVMGIHDWPGYFHKAYANLKPGGWAEAQEIIFPLLCDDGTAGPDYAPIRWTHLVKEACEKGGVRLSDGNRFAEFMREAGFTNVEEEQVKWPLGPWAKGEKEKWLGTATLENFMQGVEGISMAALTRGLGMSKAEVDALIEKTRREAHDGTKHTYIPVTIVRGQKPVDN